VTTFEKEICDLLISKYENRYNQGSVFGHKISLKFNECDYKKYVDEDAYKYRIDIDETVSRLEKDGLIFVSYHRATKDVSEVRLNIENIVAVYKLLGKTNIADKYQSLFNDLQKTNSTVSKVFCDVLLKKRKDKGSLLKYIDKVVEYCDALKAIDAINNNKHDTYMRVLSTRLFRDSKRLGCLKNYIIDVLSATGGSEVTWDEYLLLNGILKNPNYIYLKGACTLRINEQVIDLSRLKTAMAVCSDSVKDTTFLTVKYGTITTIENLTTFHDYKGEELTIYLGGFSNHSKVEMLNKLNRDVEGLSFRHFGDMDFGGFSILSHLRRETKIAIMPLHMDIKMLRDRVELSKKPSSVYLNKLNNLLKDEFLQDCHEVLQFMVDEQLILEQEAY
jgi:hypothetical protein